MQSLFHEHELQEQNTSTPDAKSRIASLHLHAIFTSIEYSPRVRFSNILIERQT